MGTIGERFKQMRKELGFSQVDVADDLRRSRDEIANIELGRLKNPETKMPLLKMACDRYGYNLNWLLTGEGERIAPARDEIADAVADLLMDRDDEFKALVLAILTSYQKQTPEARMLLRRYAADVINSDIIK